MTDDQQSPEQESCRIQPEEKPAEEGVSLKKIDLLDKRAGLAIIILLIAGVFIISNNSASTMGPTRSGPGPGRL